MMLLNNNNARMSCSSANNNSDNKRRRTLSAEEDNVNDKQQQQQATSKYALPESTTTTTNLTVNNNNNTNYSSSTTGTLTTMMTAGDIFAAAAEQGQAQWTSQQQQQQQQRTTRSSTAHHSLLLNQQPPYTPPKCSQTTSPNGNDKVQQLNTSKIVVHHFERMSTPTQNSTLLQILDSCSASQLSLLLNSIYPRLKFDVLGNLPQELAVIVCRYLSCASLGALAQVSTKYKHIVSDNTLWRDLCDKEGFLDTQNSNITSKTTVNNDLKVQCRSAEILLGTTVNYSPVSELNEDCSDDLLTSDSDSDTDSSHIFVDEDELSITSDMDIDNNSHQEVIKKLLLSNALKKPFTGSYKHLYKRRYFIRRNWHDGTFTRTSIPGPPDAIVTCLQFDDRYLIIGTDNEEHGFIEVVDLLKNNKRRVLRGHESGVWALEMQGDTLVSGGCDRDLRWVYN